MFVDIHCHLHDKRYNKKYDEIVQRAKESNVIAIVNSGIDHATNVEALRLSEQYDIIKASLGIYPLDAVGLGWRDDVRQEGRDQIDVDAEIEFIEKNKDKIVAIGEVGLDASLKKDCRLKEQKEVFKKMILLAKKLEKPLIVHTRKAEKECIDVLEECNAKKVVLHCFTGNLKLVKRAESLGFNFSIPAIITRLSHFREVVKIVPITRLLTETDGPYLAPIKGTLSEPKDVVRTTKIISEIKNISHDEVIKNIFANYQRLFLWHTS